MAETESKLIRAITLHNDKSAANELVSKYYRQIYSYVSKQLNDQAEALDVTQEVFIGMLKTLSSFNRKNSFKTWLYKIATYKVIDYYRSKNYKQRLLNVSGDFIELADTKDLEAEFENKEKATKVLDIIAGYDPMLQELLRLKIFSEYTFAQIAKMQAISESTAKTRYYSLIGKIRKELYDAD